MINFNHLYYFHVTAVEGSIKAAADRLGVTQPTVSEQIRSLERTLRVQLFERSATGLRLTQSGRDAFEHTTAMFVAGERLTEALGHADRPLVSTLRVGVSAAISRTVAADFLMPLLLIENCRPSIRTGEFNDLLRDLRAYELDLVLGESEPLPAARSGLDVVPIHRNSLVAIVPSDATPRDDWMDLSLLEYRAASAYHWEVEAFMKENGLRPALAGEVDDAFLMLEAVARGGFAAFVPRSVAREAIRAGRVRPLATIMPSAAIHAVYHSSETAQLARSAVESLIAAARLSPDAD